MGFLAALPSNGFLQSLKTRLEVYLRRDAEVSR